MPGARRGPTLTASQRASHIMSDLTNNPGLGRSDQKRRVWQLYEASRLTAAQATLQLLRLDMDESGPQAGTGHPMHTIEERRRRPRIIIADPNALARAGLRAVFADDANFDLVGEASNGHEAVALTYSMSPDLVVMEACMPD